MSVCVLVCLSVCLSVAERSKSISSVFSQICGAVFFSFIPTPKIKGSSHEKNMKIFDFLKNGSNDFD